MGIFNKLFNSSNEIKVEKKLPWIQLNATDQLDSMLSDSMKKTQIIFKHSTSCGISRMVMKQFVGSYDLKAEDVNLYYLDLLNHRDISNAVANSLNVTHESPQLLIVKNGAVKAHGSHGGVNDLELEKFI